MKLSERPELLPKPRTGGKPKGKPGPPKTDDTRVKPEDRRYDADGLLLPTDAERAEGAAFARWKADPTDENREVWRNQWNAFQKAQGGWYSPLRCNHCWTIKAGRLKTDPCAVCGKNGGYYAGEDRNG